MSLKEKAIKSVFWVGGSNVVGQAFSWVITILLARTLSPADFGLMAMATIFINFAEFFNDFGLGLAIIQRKTINEQEIDSCFCFLFFVGSIISILFYFAAPVGVIIFRNDKITDIIKILSFVFIFVAMRTVHLSLLRRDFAFKMISIIMFITNLTSGLLTIGLAINGFGVWSLVAGFVAREIIHTIMIIIFSSHKVKFRFNFDILRPYFKFGLPITGAKLLWYVSNNFDYLIVGRILGDIVLGQYRMAFTFGRMPLKKIWKILNKIVLPVFSKLQDDNGRSCQYFLKINRYLAMFIIPANIGIFILADDIVTLVLTGKWHMVLLPLKVFLIISIVDVATILVGPLLNSRGKSGLTFKLSVMRAIVFIPFLVIGVHFGIHGILFAWVIVFPLFCLYKTSFALKELNLSFFRFISNLNVPVFGTIFMSICVIIVHSYLGGHYSLIVRVMVSIMTGVLSYTAFILYSPKNCKTEINDILRIILKKDAGVI